MTLPKNRGQRPVVAIGYSKGANDLLAAITEYPAVAERVDAIVSVSGAIGGAPLAGSFDRWVLELFAAIPGGDCSVPEDTAIESLEPRVRKRWLADTPLPDSVAYYSVITLPDADRVSRLLRPAYRRLVRTHGANDSQVPPADQIVPGSEVLAVVNADHWAVALPISEHSPLIGALLVDENDFPRQALLRAILDYVAIDVASARTRVRAP